MQQQIYGLSNYIQRRCADISIG